jgi:hypothetical protein
MVSVASNCQTASSVTNCMATVIAGFAPTAVSAKGFGYQTPSFTCTQGTFFSDNGYATLIFLLGW